jgi:hypothetical protein
MREITVIGTSITHGTTRVGGTHTTPDGSGIIILNGSRRTPIGAPSTATGTSITYGATADGGTTTIRNGSTNIIGTGHDGVTDMR